MVASGGGSNVAVPYKMFATRKTNGGAENRQIFGGDNFLPKAVWNCGSQHIYAANMGFGHRQY
jgi:hypothetical protein